MRAPLRYATGVAYAAITANPAAIQTSHATLGVANAARTIARTTTNPYAHHATVVTADDRMSRARNGSSTYSPQLADLTVTYSDSPGDAREPFCPLHGGSIREALVHALRRERDLAPRQSLHSSDHRSERDECAGALTSLTPSVGNRDVQIAGPHSQRELHLG